ncbi:MAG: hypothetical protein ACR2GB_06030 [Nocardioidaceae bacterium]
MHTLSTTLPPPPRRRRLQMWLLLLATGLPLLAYLPVATAAPTQADPVPIKVTTTVTDRDDTPGRLDVARVRHRLTVFDRDHVRVASTV